MEHASVTGQGSIVRRDAGSGSRSGDLMKSISTTPTTPRPMLEAEEYTDHMKELGEARKERNLSLVKYNSYKKWLDLIQTKEANLRTEMRIK